MHGTLEQFTPVSLRDLRIDIPDDPLKLAKDQLLIAKAEDTGGVIYLAISDHPYLGVHFNQFLSRVAPKGSARFKSGASADFQMPPAARGEVSTGRPIEEVKRLHAIHSIDPDIAVPYKEFVRDHNDRWLEAINDNTYDSLFRHLHDLILIDNRREFTTHLLSCWLDYYKYASIRFDWYFIDYLFYEKGNKFGRFLKAQPGFEGIRLKRKYERNPKPYKSSPYSMLDFNMPGVEVIEKYFAEEVTEEERIKLTLDHVMYAVNVNVDYRAFLDVEKPLLYLGRNVTQATSKKRGLWIKQRDRSRDNPTRVRLLSRTKVKVDDDSDTFLHIQARGAIPSYSYDAYNMDVVRYSFGQDFRSRGRYPLLAWENADGRRRFLRQEEVASLLPKTGFQYHPQADVFMGRVLAAYFSPKVTDGWDEAMFLQHQKKEEPQDIANAQVAVWVSLDSDKYPHAPQLLADSNPFFPRLESYAA